MNRSEHVILWTKVCHGNFFLDTLHPSHPKVTWDQDQFSFRFVITFRRARRNENKILAVAVRENVWEPLKLGLISGYSKATVATETYGYAWARQCVHETLEVRWECVVCIRRIGCQITVIFYPVTVISQWLSSIFPHPEMSCPFPSILTFSAAKFYYLNSVTLSLSHVKK